MSVDICNGNFNIEVATPEPFEISVQSVANVVEVVMPTPFSVSLSGCQGPKGAKGDQGDQGPAGPKGEDGIIGVDGKSAYEIWVDEGNVGTEQDFLDSLVGEKGDQGDDGVAIDFIQNTTPTGTGTGSIPAGALWFHTDTGIQYTYYYDGNTYQWTQETLPLGPQGPQGANGTNTINSLTATTFNGLLKGNGATVGATDVLTELGYTPENVANKEDVALDNSSTKYPTNNLVKTSLDSFSDDVDYAIMTNQRLLFNF